MDRLKFKNTVQKIAPQKWEQDLEIGNFTNIKTGKIFKRPFSYIAKCRVNGTNNSKEVYIKVYSNHNNIDDKALQEQVVTDFNNTRHWHTLFTDSKQFHIVKPVMIIPELFLMVTEAIDGDSLGSIIKKKALFYKNSKIEKELEQCCYNTGKWLKFKNEKLADYKKKYSVDDLLEYLDIRLNILCNERQIIPTKIRQHILRYIQSNKKNIPENELLISASHSDFNAGNVIIQN